MRAAWCERQGPAAEFGVAPAEQAVPLPDDGVPFEVGACLGIPGITAHRAVHVAGPVNGRTALVQGGGGGVGQCAIAIAQYAGADVVATVRSGRDVAVSLRAVVRTDGLTDDEAAEAIRREAPDGVAHVVEVAFGANVWVEEAVLVQAGSIAAYATGAAEPSLPFWPLLFENVCVFLLGSGDFPAEAKRDAARAVNEALAWGRGSPSSPSRRHMLPLRATRPAPVPPRPRAPQRRDRGRDRRRHLAPRVLRGLAERCHSSFARGVFQEDGS